MDEEYEAEDELEDVEAAYREMDEITVHLLKGEYEFHFVSYFDIKQALFYPTTTPTPPDATLLTPGASEPVFLLSNQLPTPSIRSHKLHDLQEAASRTCAHKFCITVHLIIKLY